MQDGNCPWSAFDAGTVHFCEERLCAWVAEPSNAWSSVFYVVIGVAMLLRSSRSAVQWAVFAAQFMIGIGSFFFHASGIFWGEFVDQIGMFLLSALVLTFAAAQLRAWSTRRAAGTYVAMVILSSLLLLVVRPAGIPLFALQLAAGQGLQLWLWRRSGASDRYRPFLVGIGIFGVSFGIWLTDISGALCNPQNHFITGHAIWHALNAVSVGFLAVFYDRIFASARTR